MLRPGLKRRHCCAVALKLRCLPSANPLHPLADSVLWGNVLPHAVEKTHTLFATTILFRPQRQKDKRPAGHPRTHRRQQPLCLGSTSPTSSVFAGGSLLSHADVVLAEGIWTGAKVYPGSRRFKPLRLSAAQLFRAAAHTQSPTKRRSHPRETAPSRPICRFLAAIAAMASGPPTPLRSSAPPTSAFCRAQDVTAIDMDHRRSGPQIKRTSQGLCGAP